MIITCPCNKKKFEVDASLIPDNGRNIQCGACGHVWFFKKNDQKQVKTNEIEDLENIDIFNKDVQSEKNLSDSSIKKEKISSKISPTKGSELVKYKSKSNFTFAKFIALIIVFIISFIALILVLDTFKSPIYNLIPSLEIWLFNLYEILKDIKLFIRDLF